MASLTKKNIKDFVLDLRRKKLKQIEADYLVARTALCNEFINKEERVLKDFEEFTELSERIAYFNAEYRTVIYRSRTLRELLANFAQKVEGGNDEIKALDLSNDQKVFIIKNEFDKLLEVTNTLTPLKAYGLLKDLGFDVKPLDDILSLNTPARLDYFKHNFNVDLLKENKTNDVKD